MALELQEIKDRFDEYVEDYNAEPLRGSGSPQEKAVLAEYNDRFSYLYKEMRRYAKQVYGQRTLRDDKACSAKKARIARGLLREQPDLEKGMGSLTWNKAIEYAASTDEYEKFLEERVEAYENWDSIVHLRDSIKQYMINIGGRLSMYH